MLRRNRRRRSAEEDGRQTNIPSLLSTFTPGHTGQDVAISGGTLSLPVLCTPRSGDLTENASLAVSQRTSIAVPADALTSPVTEALEGWN